MITSLPRSEIVEGTITGGGGILEGIGEGGVVIDMSTTYPTVAVAIAERLKKKHVEFLDAPVSGHPEKARKGTLTIMVGGDEGVFEKVNELIFSKLGKNVFYAGTHGTGQALKLVNNLIYNINRLAMCEGLAMGAAAGIDPSVMTRVISLSTGASYAMDKNAPGILAGEFEGGESSLKLACKTLKLITDYGHDLGACLVLGTLTKQLYDLVGRKFGVEESPASAVRFYEEIQGIEVRARSLQEEVK